MPSPYISELETTRTSPVAFAKLERGGPTTAVAEIVAALARTDYQPWRADFRSGTLDTTEDWTVVQNPSGQTITTASGALVIASGTTANDETIIRSKRVFRIPCRASVAMSISQRIANQEFYVELTSADGTIFARWKHDGTVNTTGKVEVASGTIAANQTLNSSVTTTATSASAIFEIDAAIDEVNFRNRTVDSGSISTDRAVRTKNLPHPDDDLYLQFRVKNLATPPASSTNLTIDYVYVQDVNELAVEIVGSRGITGPQNALPVSGAGGSYSLATGNSRVGYTASAGIWQDATATPLAAAATFTGTGRDLLTVATNTAFNSASAYPAEYRAMAISDQAGDLYLEVSRDNTTWRRIKQVTMSNVGTGGLYVAELTYAPKTRYARVVYINGATLQGHFMLQEVMLAT